MKRIVITGTKREEAIERGVIKAVSKRTFTIQPDYMTKSL